MEPLAQLALPEPQEHLGQLALLAQLARSEHPEPLAPPVLLDQMALPGLLDYKESPGPPEHRAFKVTLEPLAQLAHAEQLDRALRAPQAQQEHPEPQDLSEQPGQAPQAPLVHKDHKVPQDL
jgi:hypothetical protein